MTQESRDARRDPRIGPEDEQALDDALDDLEQMLGKKAARGAGAYPPHRSTGGGIDLGETSGDDWAGDSTISGLDDDYDAYSPTTAPGNIPMPDGAPADGRFAALRESTSGAGGRDDETMTDLIGAGSFGNASPAAPLTAPEDPPRDLDALDEDRIWSNALTDRVAQRLASEIEVITQTCLEQSLERVAAQVREQIRAHINIVLPEILEEMAREEFEDPDDNPDLDEDTGK